MRAELYPKVGPWLWRLAIVLSVPANYWWIGLIAIGLIVVLGGVSLGQALLLGLVWGAVIVGSVVALGVLAAVESRWRAEWDASGGSTG